MATKLLDTVKEDLSITHTKKDNDIEAAIETAKQRLSQIGVGIVSENNKTTATAIKLFCRYWFNFQGDGDRYLGSFEALANAMSKASEFREEDGSE